MNDDLSRLTSQLTPPLHIPNSIFPLETISHSDTVFGFNVMQSILELVSPRCWIGAGEMSNTEEASSILRHLQFILDSDPLMYVTSHLIIKLFRIYDTTLASIFLGLLCD